MKLFAKAFINMVAIATIALFVFGCSQSTEAQSSEQPSTGSKTSATSEASASTAPSGSSESTASSTTPAETGKPDRNGFNEEGLSSIEVTGLQFRLPAYYALSEDESADDMSVYHTGAESGGTALVIAQTVPGISSTEDEFSQDADDYINEIASYQGSIFNRINTVEYLSVAGMPGKMATLTGDVDGIAVDGKVLVFYNVETKQMGSLTFAQSETTDYDYAPDFARIVDSATLS